jgi:hypothetical protein
LKIKLKSQNRKNRKIKEKESEKNKGNQPMDRSPPAKPSSQPIWGLAWIPIRYLAARRDPSRRRTSSSSSLPRGQHVADDLHVPVADKHDPSRLSIASSPRRSFHAYWQGKAQRFVLGHNVTPPPHLSRRRSHAVAPKLTEPYKTIKRTVVEP